MRNQVVKYSVEVNSISNVKNFLPNVVVLGAQKCGTTWLFKNLQTHPDILIPRKEIHYFTRHHSKGIEWYSNYYKDAYNGQKILMDIATNYLYDHDYFRRYMLTYHRNIAEEIYNTLNEAKLILMVRDPIDRAFSQYINLLQETITYGAIYSGKIKPIDSLKARKMGFKYPKHWPLGFKLQDRDAFFYVPDTFEKAIITHPYLLMRGFFATYLKKYLEYFKKDQFLFLEFNMLKKNPKGLLNSVYDFLGIERYYDEEFLYKRINPASKRKIVRNWSLESYIIRILREETIPHKFKIPLKILSKLNLALGKKAQPKPKKETIKILSRWYKPHNLELEKITGLNLSHWK